MSERMEVIRMTVNLKSFVLDNRDAYRDMTSSLRKQKQDLLALHDILMHDDILMEYEGLCFRAIVDDLTFRFGLPYEQVMESIEDINVTKLLDEEED